MHYSHLSGTCHLAAVAKSNIICLYSFLSSLPSLPPFLSALLSSISPSLSYTLLSLLFVYVLISSFILWNRVFKYVAQAGLKIMTFLSQTPQDCRLVSPGLGNWSHFSAPYWYFLYPVPWMHFWDFLLPSTAMALGKPSLFLNCCYWWEFLLYLGQFQWIVIEQPDRSLSA